MGDQGQWEYPQSRFVAPAVWAAVVILISAAAWLTSRWEQPQITVDASPQRVGRSVVCPSRTHVAIIDGFAYPPTLARPAGAQAAACFAELDDAHVAGFDLPPLQSVTAVHGLYLHAPDPYAQRVCRKAAAAAGRPMPCPRLLPNAGAVEGCTWCLLTGTHLLHYSGFPVTSGWCDRCRPYLVVAAAPSGFRDDALALTGCGPHGVRAHVGDFLECRSSPPGKLHVHAGHTMRRGTRDGLSYVVSADGYGPGPRALVEAVYRTLVFVRP